MDLNVGSGDHVNVEDCEWGEEDDLENGVEGDEHCAIVCVTGCKVSPDEYLGV